jgi:hypothetical protein
VLGHSLSYTIDADDRLVDADQGFFSFARQNLWSGARASIGRPLWDFVSGPEVERAQRALLRRVRESRRPVRLPFRCDAPALRREMAIEIEPVGRHGAVTFSTYVERETIRAAQALIDPRRPHRTGRIEMCGWCDRFQARGRWCEAEVAIGALEATVGGEFPQITHGLCDSCAETLTTA